MRRERTLEAVVPLAAAEPDGLLITTDGAYVRLLEAREVLQPLHGGPARREQIRQRLAGLAGRVPAGHGLQVIVEAEPLDTDRALAADWRHADDAAAAARQRGEPQLAEAMRRLAYGLEQTIRRSAPAVDAAVLGWTIACRWQPTPEDLGAQLRAQLGLASGRSVRRIARAGHERAAVDSLRYARMLAAELEASGCDVTALDAAGALYALARCLNPRAAAAPDRLAEAAQLLDTTDPAVALAHRHALIAAVAAGAGLDFADRDHVLHLNDDDDGEVERVLHLCSAPAETSPWWLMHLMQTPPPWRMAVHLTATDRARARRAQRLRYKRLWADMRRRERDGKLIGEDAYAQEREAAELDAELRLIGASGIYELSCYLAIRRPAGSEAELAEFTEALAKDFEGITDARLYGGRFLAESSFVATLPLASDRARATRRFAARNIGDCLPLLTASATSRGGVPLGYAQPGQTLERIDLFDRRYRTHVALITGMSGSGKTVATNALLARSLARGARGYIIDRSSSEDESGSTRHAGHYEQLVDLIPGARTVHFGAGHHDAVLCPWDTPDAAHVPASKIEFLVALHTLLIGDHDGGGGGERQLRGLERTLLAKSIQAVYTRCAGSGEPPREALLQQELLRLAREQTNDSADGDASVASELRRLAARLDAYIGDAPSAWVADRPSTIAPGGPLVLFDLAGLPDALAGPVMLTLVDFIDRDVQRRRAAHIARPDRHAGPWAGRAFVVIDEAWKPLMTPAAGAWLNEWARRTRHIACALIVVTQHLADFANPQGRALLRNSVLRLLFHTAVDELAGIGDSLGLHPEDLDAITRLETRKGEYSSCLLDSEAHGRTTVQIPLGDMEYWCCSADPDRDQPLRQLALADADGDPWDALRRLVDPDWHRQQADRLRATPTPESDLAPAGTADGS